MPQGLSRLDEEMAMYGSLKVLQTSYFLYDRTCMIQLLELYVV